MSHEIHVFRTQTPADGPFWLTAFARSVEQLFRRIMPSPFRFLDFATADLPTADVTNKQGVVYDDTLDTLVLSNGTAWVTIPNLGGTYTWTGVNTFNSIVLNGPFNLTSSGYFIGDVTNGYRFRNAADSATLLTLSDNGVLVPGADNTQSLGSAILRWADFRSALATVGTLSLTNALTVANGGTGAATFTNNRVLTGNGTSALVDEANLTFDGSTLVITGGLTASTFSKASDFRIEGTGTGFTGTGVGGEFYQSGGTFNIVSYNRTTAANAPLALTASAISLSDPTTATTQSAGDNSTKVATTAYVRQGVPHGIYRLMADTSGSHIAGRVAGTYGLGQNSPIAISGTGQLQPMRVIRVVNSELPDVDGLAPKFRVHVALAINDTAPGHSFVFGLHPVTRPASSGAAGVLIYTVGTAVTGSTTTFTTPAADSHAGQASADFDPPSDGLYVIGMVTDGTTAASSLAHVSASLELRYA